MTWLGRPKPVEVHHRDRWHIGALLGWRHDADGTCRLRVTALVDGYKRTAWVELDTVRLPLPPARPTGDARTQRLPRHGDRTVRTPPPSLPRPRSWARPGQAVEPLRPAPA
ncbi:hypothetical protein SAMN05660991_02417 [Trujillonella endophytica]|uniref:Uncharacterized protein n=1 Tax=Trujillonella endophytica TaxID=673521 RepID=A0A1H8TP28_9ACTN|nr:hypothetical protein SAMN05660991_02417 [Trujillella endophytica]